jgi:FkbM family methyltransferase
VLGECSHKLMLRIMPAGARFAVRVRKGTGAGLRLSLDPRYEAQYAAGFHETVLLACLAAHLKPGDVLYDVGAHIGYISLVAARLVGPGGKVFAFEADPENALRIIGHAEMNALPQVELVGAAVWSECKTLSFNRAAATSSRNTGAVTTLEQGKSAEGIIVVEAVTLDHFVADHRSPTVVKIDVEGAEEEVLKGAEEVFRRSKPTLICEVHNERAADGVAAWLARMGYQSKWLTTGAEFPRHLVARAGGVE